MEACGGYCGPTKPKRKRTAMYPRRCLAVLSDPWRLVVARYMHRIGSKTRGARGSGAARASRDRPGGSEAFTRRFTHTNDLRFPEPRNLNGTEPTHS